MDEGEGIGSQRAIHPTPTFLRKNLHYEAGQATVGGRLVYCSAGMYFLIAQKCQGCSPLEAQARSLG